MLKLLGAQVDPTAILQEQKLIVPAQSGKHLVEGEAARANHHLHVEVEPVGTRAASALLALFRVGNAELQAGQLIQLAIIGPIAVSFHLQRINLG